MNVNDTTKKIASAVEREGIKILDAYGYEEDGSFTIAIEVERANEERAVDIAKKFGNADVFTHNSEASRIYVIV